MKFSILGFVNEVIFFKNISLIFVLLRQTKYIERITIELLFQMIYSLPVGLSPCTYLRHLSFEISLNYSNYVNLFDIKIPLQVSFEIFFQLKSWKTYIESTRTQLLSPHSFLLTHILIRTLKKSCNRPWKHKIFVSAEISVNYSNCINSYVTQKSHSEFHLKSLPMLLISRHFHKSWSQQNQEDLLDLSQNPVSLFLCPKQIM